MKIYISTKAKQKKTKANAKTSIPSSICCVYIILTFAGFCRTFLRIQTFNTNSDTRSKFTGLANQKIEAPKPSCANVLYVCVFYHLIQTLCLRVCTNRN